VPYSTFNSNRVTGVEEIKNQTNCLIFISDPALDVVWNGKDLGSDGGRTNDSVKYQNTFPSLVIVVRKAFA